MMICESGLLFWVTLYMYCMFAKSQRWTSVFSIKPNRTEHEIFCRCINPL